MSRRPVVPTDKERAQVEAMAGYGVPQDDIACILGIDAKTLRLRYRHELDVGIAKANAKIGQTLFQKAVNGDTASLIFWAKARMGWSEKQVIENTGPNGGPQQHEHKITTTHHVVSADVAAKAAQILAAAGGTEAGYDE
jgi:hypothetical protein